MPELSQILSKKVTVINDLGVHARSAAMIAKIAQNAQASVWLEKDGEKVDATSIIDILTLGCAKGTDVTIAVDHPSDTKILNDIVSMFNKGFGE
jgi:phosphotransferase system HPr (HPr) family protein